MVDFVIKSLDNEGATQIKLVAFKTNEVGNLFWHEVGWNLKDNVNMYEYILDSDNIRLPNLPKE